MSLKIYSLLQKIIPELKVQQVPQDDEQLNQIVDLFNEDFNQDGDLNMAIY